MDSDYNHLNDVFDTDTNDQSMYDHAKYISKIHSASGQRKWRLHANKSNKR